MTHDDDDDYDLHSDPPVDEINYIIITGVLASTNSGVSKRLASWLHKYNVPIVSPTSESQDLSDSLTYPYFMRTVPSTLSMNKVSLLEP